MRPTTKSLITLICGFYLAALVIPNLQDWLLLVDKRPMLDGNLHGVGVGEYWRLLTVALTHGGPIHLFLNMYALLLLGNTLEDALGRNKFLIIFIVSQIGASLASLTFNPEYQQSVGASGAIFGLFGAMAVLTRKYGFQDKSIYAVIGINFAIGFLLPMIDWQAHLGGLIAGVLVSLFLLAPARS